jgi:hypothetical protein
MTLHLRGKPMNKEISLKEFKHEMLDDLDCFEKYWKKAADEYRREHGNFP